MDPETLTHIMLLCTVIAAAFLLVPIKKSVRNGILFCSLSIWASAVLSATLWNREAIVDQTAFGGLFASYRYVLSGGNPEILRSNYMNVFLFYPAGVLTQVMDISKNKKIKLLCFLMFSSICIEAAQFFLRLGYAECDDVLHNGEGLLLGYWVTGLLVWMLRAVFCRNRKKSPENADQ